MYSCFLKKLGINVTAKPLFMGFHKNIECQLNEVNLFQLDCTLCVADIYGVLIPVVLNFFPIDFFLLWLGVGI